MKITGTFKDYNNLLQVYGTDVNQEIDLRFDNFLKFIAQKDCIFANYNPVAKTFDAALLVDNPNSPGNKVQQMIDPIMRQYTQNISIDTLDSHNCEDCNESIFCTKCGHTWEKDSQYDYMPEFTFGELYDGECTKNDQNNKSGTTIAFSACIDGKIFCPVCRHHEKFDEVQNSF